MVTLTVTQYRNPESISSTPTKMTSRSSRRERRLSAYDLDFGQLLSDNHVFRVDSDQQPTNYEDWQEVLIQPRASLSPSRRSDSSFRAFRRASERAMNEEDVTAHIVPRVLGENRPPSGRNIQFGHMTPLNSAVVTAKPDYYEGTEPAPGNRTIRERLNRSIIPSIRKELPFLPTLFLEAKGPDGGDGVARNQVRHDGA